MTACPYECSTAPTSARTLGFPATDARAARLSNKSGGGPCSVAHTAPYRRAGKSSVSGIGAGGGASLRRAATWAQWNSLPRSPSARTARARRPPRPVPRRPRPRPGVRARKVTPTQRPLVPLARPAGGPGPRAVPLPCPRPPRRLARPLGGLSRRRPRFPQGLHRPRIVLGGQVRVPLGRPGGGVPQVSSH